MKRKDFNKNWDFRRQGEETHRLVHLPHDAQITEKRDSEGAGGGAHGYFPGGIYEYEKNFFVPEDWKEKTVSILFEGVYKNASVYAVSYTHLFSLISCPPFKMINRL